jgi:hypothetical protein
MEKFYFKKPLKRKLRVLFEIHDMCKARKVCAGCELNLQQQPTRNYPKGRCMLLYIPKDWKLETLEKKYA